VCKANEPKLQLHRVFCEDDLSRQGSRIGQKHEILRRDKCHILILCRRTLCWPHNGRRCVDRRLLFHPVQHAFDKFKLNRNQPYAAQIPTLATHVCGLLRRRRKGNLFGPMACAGTSKRQRDARCGFERKPVPPDGVPGHRLISPANTTCSHPTWHTYAKQISLPAHM
jgi:hypothetical protein